MNVPWLPSRWWTWNSNWRSKKRFFWKKTRQTLADSKKSRTFASQLRNKPNQGSQSRANGQIPEWPNGADCKSAGLRLRWFESIFAHRIKKRKFSKTSSFFILRCQGLILPDNGRNQIHRYVSWHRAAYHSERQRSQNSQYASLRSFPSLWSDMTTRSRYPSDPDKSSGKCL